ncbi:MAG: 3-methyl-2-oxobutanoate hydroxymethyltransferase [Candidatus Hydrogenedentes bacterium]|nr:3-methyl-2-oxobutanoate hydroxymethyltransferase [Candidatus Hydrogenedentota bacterium]
MRDRITPVSFRRKKEAGEKIAVLTAYDFPGAQLADEAGVDAILVGDSVGMAVMGLDCTLPVTMDVMHHHTAMVARAVSRALVVADLPFLSYHTGEADAVRNAGRLTGQAGAHAVKLEGPADQFGGVIQAILRAGIPVMGHVGLTPQSVLHFGGFKVQGRSEEDSRRILAQARALEEAGCFAVVLECIPSPLAAEITAALRVPTIGIGAGPACDGQVLVMHDLLGWGKARFAKTYHDVRGEMAGAFAAYVREVREGAYPGPEHQYE